MTVAWDGVVDGVLRASNFYTAKAVACQKGKKFEINSFLYQNGNGIIDTTMMATAASFENATQGDGPETLGTIELRLYMLRRFGEEHVIGDVPAYHNQKKLLGDSESVQKELVAYKLTKPDLKMTFEEDCATLHSRTTTLQRAKADKPRPGKSPWAVFRFHYRSKGIYYLSFVSIMHTDDL
jgi:hypothetical protein